MTDPSVPRGEPASRGASFELRDVSVEWPGGGGLALAGVSASIAAGEAVAIVGPSGAGKTTLLRLIGATLPPSSGNVLIDGRDVSARDAGEIRRLRARLGFVPQDHGLVATLRVSQNVLAGRLGQRGWFAGLRSMVLPSRADLSSAYEVLESLGIAHKLFERVDQLSGGERQRVAVARAMFQEPRGLLADEPVASVDPARSRDLVERMLALATSRGSSLVVSLHDVELARDLFPRILGLREGRIRFDGPASEFDGQALDDLYRLEEPRLA